MSKRLENKVCIITGSGGSMGQSACELFSRQGAKIVGCDINEERANETLDLVRSAGGEMLSLGPCNLTSPDGCADLVSLAIKSYGKIDVLYNNAATAYWGWVNEISIEDFDRTIDEELKLVFLLCRAAWDHMVANGGGSIINVGSTAGKVAIKGLPGIAHSTAKAGVLGLTRHLAMEGGPHLIRANSISPGATVTNQTRETLSIPEVRKGVEDSLMIKRLGQPEDIANCALFLASDESTWITGADIAVDGGICAQS